MTNARRILNCLDSKLTSRVELTLYGRAALHLGFDNAPEEQALSRDVDAVLWIGQAEALFIVRSTRLERCRVEEALAEARVPDVPEIQEQFEIASRKLLAALR